MISRRFAAPLVLSISLVTLLGLAGCNDSDSGPSHFNYSTSISSSSSPTSASSQRIVIHQDDSYDIHFSDGKLQLQAKGKPDASIAEDGRFSIDNQPVTLTPAQQQLFKGYYQQSMGMVHAGIAVGTSGAEAGLSIAAGVLGNLAAGKTDDASMDTTVNQHLQGISDSVSKICDQLAALQQQQDLITSTVSAFGPYAHITAQDISECHDNQRNILKSHHHFHS